MIRENLNSLHPAKMVDVSALKAYVRESLPPTSLLRDILLMENDVLRPEEFVYKAELWLLLLRKG